MAPAILTLIIKTNLPTRYTVKLNATAHTKSINIVIFSLQLTSAGSVSVRTALNPTILNMMILEKIDVKEFVRHTVNVFASVLYPGLV